MGNSFFDAFARTLEQELGLELTGECDIQGKDTVKVSNWMLEEQGPNIAALRGLLQLFLEAKSAPNLRCVIVGVVFQLADRHPWATALLAEAALQDPDWTVRLELAEHAWKLQRDGQELLKKLAEDRDEAVREAAANGLGFAA